MIKFFRKIRQQLLTENKLSKYLLYAIGEIVLVMIGILLALQVSNWNATRVKNKLEKTILTQLNNDVNRMLGDMRGDYAMLKNGIKSHLKTIKYLEQDVVYNDTMCFDFHWLIEDEYMYPITTTYDLLKKEGVELIKNDSIRMITRNSFEFALPRISKQSPFYPDLENFLGPFYQKHFTPNRDSNLVYKYKMRNSTFTYPYEQNFEGEVYNVYFGFVPNDFEALKKSSEFKVLLKQSFKYRTYKVSRYKDAIHWLEYLSTLIEKELN